MAETWRNWSGSLEFRPGVIEKPRNEEEVRQVVLQALQQKQTVRVVGAGHSSVPLVKTDQVLLDQENLTGVLSHDKENMTVKIMPGTHIADSGPELMKLNVSMHNTGDVDYQRIAGAFGTGTHGSGITLQNLPGMMVGCRLVDGTGQVREYNQQEHPDMLQALKLSLGALGIITELTIKVLPAQKFVRREYCTHIDTCLEHLDELIGNNKMFDFYWYPRNDLAKLRLCNPEGEGMQDLPFAELVKEEKGYLYEILPKSRTLKFDEMEYAFPFENGPACFKEIRQRIKEKHRHYVGWRVLYRTVAADDVYLSPFSGRDSVTIAVLQNNQLEYKKYFADIEPIYRSYDGRPHWGKKHTLKAKDLQQLYPEWDKYMKIRKQLDPDGIFLNDYLRELFGL